MVLVKTFNDADKPVVFQVQPQHVSRIEFVREYGMPRFVRHASTWCAFTPDGVVPVTKGQAAALEDMKMDFAQAAGWGFQIKEKKYIDGQLHEEWKWVRPTGGTPYVFDTEQAALDVVRMCYPDMLVSSGRVQAHGWRPLPCNVVAQIDVRAISTPGEEDEEVEGCYEVEVDSSHAQHAGDIALDVFHSKIGIHVLDDFEIRVFDARTGRALELAETWAATDGANGVYLGKIASEPTHCFSVEVGAPDDLLYTRAEVFAEDEQMAIEKMQKALNYPQESLTYRADCLDQTEKTKGTCPC